MGSQIVSYRLYGGGNLLVEVDRGEGAEATSPLEPPQEAFDRIVAQVKPGVGALLAELNTLPEPPSQVSMEFGVKLTGGTQPVIAKTTDGGQFKLTLTWGLADRPSR